MQATLHCFNKYSDVLAVSFKVILTHLFLDFYQKYIVQIFASLRRNLETGRSSYPVNFYLFKETLEKVLKILYKYITHLKAVKWV